MSRFQEVQQHCLHVISERPPSQLRGELVVVQYFQSSLALSEVRNIGHCGEMDIRRNPGWCRKNVQLIFSIESP